MLTIDLRARCVTNIGLDVEIGKAVVAMTASRNEERSLEMDAMNLVKNDAAMTNDPLMQGIEALIRRIWLLPGDAEEGEIENYAITALKCVQGGDSINNLEGFLGQIQTNRLQQPYTKLATRELAERAFALIKYAS